MVYMWSKVQTTVLPVELQKCLKWIGLLVSSGYLRRSDYEICTPVQKMSNSTDILLKQATSYSWVVTLNYKYKSTNYTDEA